MKEVGRKEVDDYMADYAVEAMSGKGDQRPLQLRLMQDKGITCSAEEIKPKPITMAQLPGLSDREMVLLGNCQLEKLGDQMGDKEAIDYMADSFEKEMKKDPKHIESMQHQMMRERGISCTRDEMNKVF